MYTLMKFHRETAESDIDKRGGFIHLLLYFTVKNLILVLRTEYRSTRNNMFNGFQLY